MESESDAKLLSALPKKDLAENDLVEDDPGLGAIVRWRCRARAIKKGLVVACKSRWAPPRRR